MDTDLLNQSRALGDPTRHAIFRHIVSSKTPVGVAELTNKFGLHHNAIRQHLSKLVKAKLITESKFSVKGRGRPRLRYELAATAESRWGVTGPYERLTFLFSEIIRSGDTPVEVGRRSVQLNTTPNQNDSDPIESMSEVMARYGFDPKVKRKGKYIDIVFGSCPFETTAIVDPENVCGLHHGIAQGVANNIGGGLVVDALDTDDPRNQSCKLKCHTESEHT